jgi:DegV family protein with EDD domain
VRRREIEIDAGAGTSSESEVDGVGDGELTTDAEGIAGPARSAERRVAVLTDSAAMLPRDLAERCEVVVVPLMVNVGGQSFADGEMPDDDLLERIDEGVTTSGPAPGAFAAAIERVATERPDLEGIVVVTVAKALSGTYGAARLAAESASVPVTIVDSETAAGAEALVVLAAAERALAGGSVAEVVAAAAVAIDEVRLVGSLNSLERLVASGRVPGIAGKAGQVLGVNPLFELRRGKVRPLRPAFSRDAALERILGLWRGDKRAGTVTHVVALHAVAREDAKRLLEALRDEEEPATYFLGAFGPAMIAHAGPGVVGLAWRWSAGSPPPASAARLR